MTRLFWPLAVRGGQPTEPNPNNITTTGVVMKMVAAIVAKIRTVWKGETR